jgi:hypothetical protein
MTLKSALEDLKETTLAAVSGVLGKLAYLASLRRGQDQYEHWGMETVHGKESSQRALRTAHSEVLTSVLRTPLRVLMEDLEESSKPQGMAAQEYVASMQEHFQDLLPGTGQDSPTALHLNSVLAALSSLKKTPTPATRPTS